MQDQMSGVENAGSENAKPENPRNGGSTAGMWLLCLISRQFMNVLQILERGNARDSTILTSMN